jgi:hypothetical protein
MTEEFSDPGKQRTRDFLEGVKQAIASPATRIECIAELGLTLDDVRDAILGLSVADYCGGPLHDRNMPGDLWVFGKVMEGREVYIKLKLAKIGPVKRVRVVSFHFPKEPLCYPYRSEEQKKGGA